MTERPLASSACPAFGPQLAALLDGELSATDRAAITEHLRGCPGCAASLEEQRMARSSLRMAATAVAAPAVLRAQIGARLDRAAAERGRRGRLALLGGLAAALTAIAVIGLLRINNSASNTRVLAAAAAGHRQETLAANPVSFASDDPSAVAAWARATSGHSIDIPSLAAEGYELLGARAESSIAADAVSLVYTGPSGRVTCTVLPASGPSTTQAGSGAAALNFHQAQIDGASVAGWTETDATYVLVANLPPPALLQLARLAAVQ
jgi:anti-sigma factor RsiW